MLRDFIERIEFGVRIAFFIFAMVCGMVVLLAGTKAALAASLRNEGIITGEYIRLGDIFDGVKNADYVLGPAPQPGKDMILNARTLYKIASALDVQWTPSSSGEQIILRREASVIPQSEMISVIENKLREQGMDEKFTVSLNTAPESIVLPADVDGTLEISNFKFDAQRDVFNAVLVAPSAANPLKRVTVTGDVERMTSVPVLKNTLKNGDIISAHDIEWIDLPNSKIVSGTVTDEKSLINMTPRRVASGGKPINLNDLERPKMVDRGDNVTLVFETGPMTLTTKGKALQAGAIGDSVRVANLDSNKSLQGIITNHREVTIR